ncbi:hypothetical protein K523DRAFT_356812 [Schizophyllum commune Tattone D]|nr:hypothetical protein K523DRAFT_356812 [Schizophyllum commune Tattone D]
MDDFRGIIVTISASELESVHGFSVLARQLEQLPQLLHETCALVEDDEWQQLVSPRRPMLTAGKAKASTIPKLSLRGRPSKLPRTTKANTTKHLPADSGQP